MKKNHQGYIETENFGQSRNFLAFNIAIEDWSVYRTRVNKLGLEMKKTYQGYIRIKKFWPISHFVVFKIAIEDWSVYWHMSIIAINWIFLQNGFNQNLETRAWNEEKLPMIHWIRKFWPVSQFCCVQNGHRRLVGLQRVSTIAINWILSPKRLNQNLHTRAWNEKKTTKDTLNQKILPKFKIFFSQICHRRIFSLPDRCQ